MDARTWLDRPAQFQRVSLARAEITVLRDDLLEGGSKLRFLPFLCAGADEVVFGGPFCGGAPHALSVWARDAGKRATLFYAEREELHWRQRAAQANGAKLVFVRPGYMTVVQKRAQDYARERNALFLPLGFDVPAAIEPLHAFALRVRAELGTPDQVWLAAGSGMLTRVVASAFPDAEICAVAVGLESRHSAQRFGPNVRMLSAGMPFGQPKRGQAPFPSCRNYDLKAWAACERTARGRVLFWNVAGNVLPSQSGTLSGTGSRPPLAVSA